MGEMDSQSLCKNRVREFRENKLMTQAQLARKAKVALRTIHSVEKGMNCRMDTKRKILLALGLRFEDKDLVFPPPPGSALFVPRPPAAAPSHPTHGAHGTHEAHGGNHGTSHGNGGHTGGDASGPLSSESDTTVGH